MVQAVSRTGDASAQNRLGVCYEEGEGVEKDIQEAVGLYGLAAEQGRSTGQCSLATCYLNGDGVEKTCAKR